MQLDLTPAAWIEKASRDLAMARAGEQMKFYDEALYHYHQACEKLLKAVLVHFEGAYPRTHDLRALLNLGKANVHDLGQYEAQASMLAGVHAAARYPISPPITEEEFQLLCNAAQHLVSKLTNLLQEIAGLRP
jgi:HEPN domain-containing protein